MILVDASVWIDHFRRGRADLAAALEIGAVGVHPFVIGELAIGSLRTDSPILEAMVELPMARQIGHEEAMTLIHRRRLAARGIGWIDLHLIGSALLEGWSIWTLDRPLDRAVRDLKIAWEG
ncbi:MAG TPA: type II toxin-antitoxin system VapC family toxin [Vicinamibacterales bacterium]|nr:type II toxin-antitoxin system VapC family toxin [Vicinamibacterales bacterium]